MKINLIKRDENKKVSSQIKFTILAIILIAIFSLALTPVTFQNDTFYECPHGFHSSVVKGVKEVNAPCGR